MDHVYSLLLILDYLLPAMSK